MHLARHFEVLFREMVKSLWSTKGLANRSCTEAAKAFRSSLGRDSVGMTSSYRSLFIKPRITGSYMQSRTMSRPAK